MDEDLRQILKEIVKKYSKEYGLDFEDIVIRDLIPEKDFYYIGKSGGWTILEVPDISYILLCGNRTNTGEITIWRDGYILVIYTNYDGQPYVWLKDCDIIKVKGDYKALRGYVIDKMGTRVYLPRLKRGKSLF